jgi:peroxiredoxin
VGTALTLLADGNADLVKAAGLDFDLTKAGLGIRSQRWVG